MGYDQVYNLGAFKDWAEGGGAIDREPFQPDPKLTLQSQRIGAYQ